MAYHSIKSFAGALFQKPFYIAFCNIFRLVDRPLEVLRDYVFVSGVFPRDLEIKTPLGKRKITLYCYDDLITLVECFCKQDYRVRGPLSCVVDVGSNIGLSALYFLTRGPEVFAYLYEPVESNLEKLGNNLSGLESRFELNQAAIGLENGTAEFGCESTGRYGGLVGGIYEGKVKSRIEKRTDVQVRAVNDVLQEVLDKHKRIDVLKIDVEGLEEDLLKGIDPMLLDRIDRIFVETESPVVLTGFHKEQYGGVARYYR